MVSQQCLLQETLLRTKIYRHYLCSDFLCPQSFLVGGCMFKQASSVASSLKLGHEHFVHFPSTAPEAFIAAFFVFPELHAIDKMLIANSSDKTCFMMGFFNGEK